MVRIRLRKIGSKGRAVYKIVVADQRKPQGGKYLEEVGTYDPHTSPATVKIIEDRVSDWITKGAQPSESVLKLFHIIGFDNNGKIKPLELTKKKKKKSENTSAVTSEAAPAEEALQNENLVLYLQFSKRFWPRGHLLLSKRLVKQKILPWLKYISKLNKIDLCQQVR